MKNQTKVFMMTDAEVKGNVYGMDQYYSVDKEDASKLVEEGKAIQYGNDELDSYDKSIEKTVQEFRRRYEKIATSKDPRYKYEEFFRETVNEFKREMEAEVQRLQAEYAEIVKDVREEAHRQRANLTRNISPSDEKGAKQLMSELVGVAKLDGVEKAVERIENDMKYFSEGRKLAIANELHLLIGISDRDDIAFKQRLRALSNKLREDSEGVELAARMAGALSDHIGGAYTRLKSTHPSYKR